MTKSESECSDRDRWIGVDEAGRMGSVEGAPSLPLSGDQTGTGVASTTGPVEGETGVESVLLRSAAEGEVGEEREGKSSAEGRRWRDAEVLAAWGAEFEGKADAVGAMRRVRLWIASTMAGAAPRGGNAPRGA